MPVIPLKMTLIQLVMLLGIVGNTYTSVKDLLDLPLQDAFDEGKNVEEEERGQASIKYYDGGRAMQCSLCLVLGIIFCFCAKNRNAKK